MEGKEVGGERGRQEGMDKLMEGRKGGMERRRKKREEK